MPELVIIAGIIKNESSNAKNYMNENDIRETLYTIHLPSCDNNFINAFERFLDDYISNFKA